MKTNLTIAGLLLSAWLLPVTGYTADTAGAPASVNETPGATKPREAGANPMLRSDHPVDDSMITTKIKDKFVMDKQVRTDNIEIKTVNGDVELFGTARTRAKAAHAVALARQVKGVKSVKNDIQITAPEQVTAGDNTYHKDRTDKDRTADSRRSDQPVKDSWITSKVKAKLTADKQVKARNIHVKTHDGVVELTGTARNTDESSKAAELAGGIKGVKSVSNDIKVN